MPTIGILSLQGAYQAHKKVFSYLGIHTILVNDVISLQKIDGLVIPGGESTTMIFLLHKFNLWYCLKKRNSSTKYIGHLLFIKIDFLNN